MLWVAVFVVSLVAAVLAFVAVAFLVGWDVPDEGDDP